jgi:hypothetical protein
LCAAFFRYAVVAPPLPFDRLTVALDPAGFFHLVQQGVQRARTDLVAGNSQVLAELDA